MKTSPAIRVNLILQKTGGVDSQGNVQAIFGSVLEMNSLAPAEDVEDATSRAVAELRDEIREVDARLKAMGVPKQLLEGPISAAMILTAHSRMSAPWRQH